MRAVEGADAEMDDANLLSIAVIGEALSFIGREQGEGVHTQSQVAAHNL